MRYSRFFIGVIFLSCILVLSACSWFPSGSLSASVMPKEQIQEFPAAWIEDPLTQQTNGVSSENSASQEAEEVRAIWITQFELNTIRSASESEFRSHVVTMFQNCVNFHLNTVFVQVRPNGDAFYPSDLFPWSIYASGNAGEGLNYDPLAVMLEEAHNLGLKFHAWINPYRLQPESQMVSISDEYQTKQWYNERETADRVVVWLNGNTPTCYLNPGYPEVRQLIFDGVTELISQYEVDGIHIDDYFYPTTEAAFDQMAFQNIAAGQELSIWRKSNVDETVSGIYTAIKSIKPEVIFGVSPAGNIDNNQNKLYADVQKWASQPGYLDWIIPQIYWEYQHATAPYLTVLDQWNSMTTAEGVKLIAGLANYKVGTNEEWSQGDIISRQVQDARTRTAYGGFALYSYGSLFQNPTELMEKEKAQLLSLL